MKTRFAHAQFVAKINEHVWCSMLAANDVNTCGSDSFAATALDKVVVDTNLI